MHSLLVFFIFFICIQSQRGRDRKRQTGKTWERTEKALLGSEPRRAGQQRNGPESSSVIQTSLGTNTFHAFLGHFIFTSLNSHTPKSLQQQSVGGAGGGSAMLKKNNNLIFYTNATHIEGEACSPEVFSYTPPS